MKKKKRPENPLARLGIPKTVTQKWEEITPTLKKDEGDSEILLYGPIVDHITEGWVTEWYGEDAVVSAKGFREKLAAVEGNVLVRINSPGGDVWEADGIMNAIVERRNAGDEVNMVIDGLAASAATLVMMRGNGVKAGKMSSLMIHESSCMVYGNKRDLRNAADLLEGIDTQALALYSARLKDKDEDEIMALLEQETWYTADEALESGLIDEIIELDDRTQDPDAGSGNGKAAMSAEELEEKKTEFLAQQNMRIAALGLAA